FELLIVPTLGVGTHVATLCVAALPGRDAERLRAFGKNARESAARSKDERESAGNRVARPCFALRTHGHCSFFPNALTLALPREPSERGIAPPNARPNATKTLKIFGPIHDPAKRKLHSV